jgi:hypothetical protein
MRKPILSALAALMLLGLGAPLAQADPDTNIQKPGHVSISLG